MSEENEIDFESELSDIVKLIRKSYNEILEFTKESDQKIAKRLKVIETRLSELEKQQLINDKQKPGDDLLNMFV